MKKPKGILICVPAYGQTMYAQTAESIYTLGQYLTKHGIKNSMMWFSGADIEEIRNLFVTAWYDAHPEFSHLLFVDSDMGFPHELIKDMLWFDKPVTGCLYARRHTTPSIVGTLAEGHGTKDLAYGFMPSEGIGTGVMLIKREVITELLEKMPKLSKPIQASLAGASEGMNLTRIIHAFDKIKNDEYQLSEDMSFCRRCVALGIQIWANVSHRISHVGPFDYAIRYQGILEANEQAKAELAKAEAA
jgi:hypothetical protein